MYRSQPHSLLPRRVERRLEEVEMRHDGRVVRALTLPHELQDDILAPPFSLVGANGAYHSLERPLIAWHQTALPLGADHLDGTHTDEHVARLDGFLKLGRAALHKVVHHHTALLPLLKRNAKRRRELGLVDAGWQAEHGGVRLAIRVGEGLHPLVKPIVEPELPLAKLETRVPDTAHTDAG
eukprot:scaffold1813_cov129-Isochrysis_galbana.AAC.3